MSVDLSLMDDFLEDLQKYAENADESRVADILMEGAEEIANDVRKLPSPRRQISGSYTHMLDAVSAEKKETSARVGWGKFYGYFVERGTSKMRAQPHISKVWESNKNKYIETMQRKLFDIGG